MKDKEYKSELEVVNQWINKFLKEHKMPEITKEEIEAENGNK